jgi:hypothetical protein
MNPGQWHLSLAAGRACEQLPVVQVRVGVRNRTIRVRFPANRHRGPMARCVATGTSLAVAWHTPTRARPIPLTARPATVRDLALLTRQLTKERIMPGLSSGLDNQVVADH